MRWFFYAKIKSENERVKYTERLYCKSTDWLMCASRQELVLDMGTKKGQADYIAPLQPNTLASVKTWGILGELAV